MKVGFWGFDVFKKGFEKVKLFCFVVNDVVEVAFKLLIANIDDVEQLFKLFNNIDELVFKLLIAKNELDDKLSIFVFIAYPVKSGLFIIAL